MNTPITPVMTGTIAFPTMPWFELALQQARRCHQLAWFLYGWVEREQRLNLNAVAAFAPRTRAGVNPARRVPPRR